MNKNSATIVGSSSSPGIAELIASKRNRRLDTGEAASYIGVRTATLETWRSTKRHTIPYIKIGGRIFYDLEDLDTWLDSRKIIAKAA